MCESQCSVLVSASTWFLVTSSTYAGSVSQVLYSWSQHLHGSVSQLLYSWSQHLHGSVSQLLYSWFSIYMVLCLNCYILGLSIYMVLCLNCYILGLSIYMVLVLNIFYSIEILEPKSIAFRNTINLFVIFLLCLCKRTLDSLLFNLTKF